MNLNKQQVENLISGLAEKETVKINHSQYKHGLSRSRIYKIWMNMRERCTDKKIHNYKNYGGRGIAVCDEWHDFQNFCREMGEAYYDTATIERIDNDKGYSKENCKWVDAKDQSRNRTNVKLYDFHGELLNSSEIDKRLGLCYGGFRARIKRGWPVEKAITTSKITNE